jgi:hypothetical protein
MDFFVSNCIIEFYVQNYAHNCISKLTDEVIVVALAKPANCSIYLLVLFTFMASTLILQNISFST